MKLCRFDFFLFHEILLILFTFQSTRLWIQRINHEDLFKFRQLYNLLSCNGAFSPQIERIIDATYRFRYNNDLRRNDGRRRILWEDMCAWTWIIYLHLITLNNINFTRLQFRSYIVISYTYLRIVTPLYSSLAYAFTAHSRGRTRSHSYSFSAISSLFFFF